MPDWLNPVSFSIQCTTFELMFLPGKTFFSIQQAISQAIRRSYNQRQEYYVAFFLYFLLFSIFFAYGGFFFLSLLL